MGLVHAPQEETEQAQGHVRNRTECPSPNRKRRRTNLAESGQMAATRANQRRKSAGCCSLMEEDRDGHDEEDSKPSLVASSSSSARLLVASDPDQEVVQEARTTLREIPHGWTPVNLEPDC